jgi:DNA-binding MarR family transcriptional regulator
LKRKAPHHELPYREVFTKAFGDQLPALFDHSAHALNRQIHKTYNIMVAAHDDMLRPLNLSWAKYRLLVWLLACERAEYPDGRLPSALSKFQGVTPNTISALIGGLEDEGWIERQKHPTDARKTILNITDTGRTLVEDTHVQSNEWVGQLLKDLSEEERQILITLLDKMAKSILENGACSDREAGGLHVTHSPKPEISSDK